MLKIVILSFANQYQRIQDRVNKTLLKQFQNLPFNQSQLVIAMKYGMSLGEKRLKLFLVYAIGNMSIGNMLNVSVENLNIPTTAIKCIHTYSLIHSDLPIIDNINNNLHRGQPTCYISFDEVYAILASNVMKTLTFSILSRSAIPDINNSDRLAMIAELATSSRVIGIYAGQALDIESEYQQIDIAILESIHHHKISALIHAAIRMSTLAADSQSYKLQALLDNCANAIGLLF